MIRDIPLNKLVASTRNVRRSSDPAADAELKADIEARGLLQNLIVTAAKKPRGSFAVEGGGRRLAALSAIAAEGKSAKDVGIPCLVLDDIGTNAAEASLAENFQRLALNPCDECLAFQHFIDQGSDVEGVAKRFGLTVRFVEGRLRLAGLAPVVFDALGRGDITLDVAKAYASTPDRERQAFVFEQMANSYNAAHPDSIRRLMKQATVAANDPRARLVGEAAYVEAGGRIERDLFDDEATTQWLDIALLERLATEKMAAEAERLAVESGLAWVRPSLDRHVDWEMTQGLTRVDLLRSELTDAEKQTIETLETSEAENIAILESEEATDEERQAAEAEIERIEQAVEAIVEKPPVLDDSMRGTVGTFLVLGSDGKPSLYSHYYAEKLPVADNEGSAENLDPSDVTAAPKKAGLSQRLTDELAIQRRDILAVHVASDPDIALDLAIFLMVDTGRYEKSGSSLVARRPSDPVFDFKTPDAAATRTRHELTEALDRSWTGGDTMAARFDAFRLLSAETRAAWLGLAVAGTLEATTGLSGTSSCAFHDHLGTLLGIDVANWWRPTATNYFDRVTRGMMLDALTEIEGPALAARYAQSKKAELAAACEKICTGDFIGEVGTKQAARMWLPAAMRFRAATVPAEALDDGAVDEQVDASDVDAGDTSETHQDREAA
jgi:ParB family transcriptional regulator, chromosome partitioning protein